MFCFIYFIQYLIDIRKHFRRDSVTVVQDLLPQKMHRDIIGLYGRYLNRKRFT